MLKLKRHRQFVKDLSKVEWSDQHFSKFTLFLATLIKQDSLPAEALDHPLRGNYEGFRELHVSGDLLLIYKVSEENLFLVRIGTHSQLFR